jgi:hypothetical protein
MISQPFSIRQPAGTRGAARANPLFSIGSRIPVAPPVLRETCVDVKVIGKGKNFLTIYRRVKITGRHVA